MKKIVVFLILPLLAKAQSPPDYTFDPVIVVANRYEQPLSELNRSVTVLQADDIRAMNIRSISDILSLAGSVDMQRRGQFGIQGDAGIRGDSYESTLILIDGVKVNDPQTAHHNMDIPVNVDNINRIEILHGSGSALYGADAGGGIINIVTNSTSNGITARFGGGQFGLQEGAVTLGQSLGTWHNSLSASAQQSDGFTDYTDFKTRDLSYQSSVAVLNQKMSFYSGWVDKYFGANSFYSNLFPNERENTTTFFSKLQLSGSSGTLSWSPRIAFRRHDDDFILDNARPNWYRNKNTSRTITIELPMTLKSRLGTTVTTAELNRHILASSNLGDHERTLGGLALAHNSTLGAVSFSLEGYAHYYSRWGWKLWPALNLGYKIGKTRLFAFAGKSFRIPSFTELYYKSPANMGNPSLTYSETVSFELGQNTTWKNGRARLSVFVRQGQNQIDWSRRSENQPWQVNNVGTARFKGIDGDIRFYPQALLNVRSIFISGIFMSGEKADNEFEYKYTLNYLKFGLSATMENLWPGGLVSALSAQWKKREFSNAYFLLDMSLSRSIGLGRIYLRASNLLNEKYFEIPYVPTPGRWLSAGIETRLF